MDQVLSAKEQSDRPGPASEWFQGSHAPAVFWVIAVAVTTALLVLRRPDAVFYPQLWAEDGVVWFADAYNHGALRALLFARDGYLQVFPRLVAALALWAPLARVPLVFSLIALAVEALPPLFLVSSRMRNIGPLYLRCMLALLLLSVPDASEVHANITNSQSQLAVLAFLIIVSEAPASRWGKIFDVVVLLLYGLTTPTGMLLLAVVLARIVLPFLIHRPANARPPRAETRWRWIQASLLAACALVQGLTLLTTGITRLNTTLGATPEKFVRIVAGQIVLPVFLGRNRLYEISSAPKTIEVVALLITIVALFTLLYGLLRGTSELRCFIFFAGLVLMAALTFPNVQPVVRQWDVFLWPGLGLRYWYIPRLALMATLIWLLGRQRPSTIRLLAGALTCVMAVALVTHWRYPALADFQFEDYVRTFEELPSGATGQFRLNPGGPWIMKLTKK